MRNWYISMLLRINVSMSIIEAIGPKLEPPNVNLYYGTFVSATPFRRYSIRE